MSKGRNSIHVYLIRMRRRIISNIADWRIIRHFLKAPLPQWVVYVCDITIVLFSALFTILVGPGDPTSGFDGWIFSRFTRVGVVVAVYAFVFLIIKPYRSIIRLSAIEDTYHIALAVTAASAILSLIDITLHCTLSHRFVGLWNIFVIGVITFALMTVVRLLVKYIYDAVTSLDANRKRVVVLGSALNSFALAAALQSETGGRFRPVMMLSLNHSNINTTISGIPIRDYNPDTVAQVFEECECDTLLFLATQIEFMRSGGADVFLNNNIKLLMLNQIEEFGVNDDQMPDISHHVQDIKIEDLLGREPIINNNPLIEQNMHGAVVMVTGAGGSIGSEIVRQLCRFGASKLVLVDQAETPMHDLQLEITHDYPNQDVELCIADVANRSRMEQIFASLKPRYVYHAAAYKHVPMMECNPTEAITTNVFGTKNLADLAVKYGVERFVMISTDKAVNPTNIMGASKRIAEIYTQSLANKLRHECTDAYTRFITTRFGNVLGSNGSVIPLFRRQIAEGGPVTVTHRDIIRYFMTIPEACSLVLEAGCMGAGGEIYIFDMGKPVKIYDLATRMISLAGLRPGKDIQIVETGLRPGEKLYEELLNNHEQIIATNHKKIMIAKVRLYDYDDVCSRLEKLRTLTIEGKTEDVVMQMKLLVPEYKSQNSVWQAIDNRIDKSKSIHEQP